VSKGKTIARKDGRERRRGKGHVKRGKRTKE